MLCILRPKSKLSKLNCHTPPVTVEDVLDWPGETSCGIHADHISICEFPSTYSPKCRVAATNISQSQSNQIINLVFSLDSSTPSFDPLALLLHGDDVNLQQARVLIKGKRRSTVECDHVQLAESMWREQLIREVESLNPVADMRTSFMGKMAAPYDFQHRKTAAAQLPVSTSSVSTLNRGSGSVIGNDVGDVVCSTISNVGNDNSGGIHLILSILILSYLFPLIYLVLSSRQ